MASATFAMQDWGFGSFGSITTKHSHPTDAIDPVRVQLSNPFIVCIVGASRGIGASIATSYAKAGATGLILASRRVSGLEATAAECKKINPDVQIEIIPCDITSSDDVAVLADKTNAAFGSRLDVVAVNSGYSGPIKTRLTDTDPGTFQNAINVNYVGTFLCAKYLIPLLLQTEGGAKAFIAVSTVGTMIVRGPIANTQYCVSKAAQLKLMEHIHEQYHGEGLAAYSVHPGAVLSEMAEETVPDNFRSFLKDSPELCGAWCVWLTKGGSKRDWLSGRLVSATWDANELEARKDEVVSKDLFKMKMTQPVM